MKVKGQDILLRTNQKIILGSNGEYEIYYDGSDFIVKDSEGDTLRITSVSAASIEADNRVREYAAGLGSPSGNIINRATEYTDSVSAAVSAASHEQDLRIREDLSTVSAGIVFTEYASDNIVGGENAGSSITAGASDNFLTGKEAGFSLTTGDRNIAIGYQAMYTNSQAGGNICLGYQAGNKLQYNGWTQNVFIGHEAGYYDSVGTNNVCVGYRTGFNQWTGDRNILIGSNAGQGAGGHSWDGNIAIGYHSGLGLKTGGNYNTLVGYYAGRSLSTGANNVFIGNEVGYDGATGNKNIMIGDDLELPDISADNQLLIGNATYPFLKGDMANYTLSINGSAGYLNFNTTLGVSGYGIRDNAGTLELKDSGGSWSAPNVLDSTPSVDHTTSGIITQDVVGKTVFFGNLLYRSFTNDKYMTANASAASKMPGTVLTLDTSAASGAKINLLHEGYVRDDTWNWSEGIIYAASANGRLTQTAPGNTGDQIQAVGYAKSADIMYFDPSLVIAEVG